MKNTIAEALRREAWTYMVISGGIRTHEPMLELFETIIDLVLQHRPNAAIAFNTTPGGCADLRPPQALNPKVLKVRLVSIRQNRHNTNRHPRFLIIAKSANRRSVDISPLSQTF